MEFDEIHEKPRETKLFDQFEGVSEALSADCDAAPAEHRMTIGDTKSVPIGAEETAAPCPCGPASGPTRSLAVFPLDEHCPDSGSPACDSGAELRRAVRRRRWTRRGLRVLVLTLGLYLLVFNLSVVRGSSMAPGIHDGDRILIGQWSYVFGEIERGDVVVMRYPMDPRLDYIKRIIGLPGDEIRMSGGGVWVNGKRLEEPYVGTLDSDLHFYTRVRPEHYFVLGDNRPHSSDSREFGQVPREMVKGRVDLRVWPLDRAGWVR